jgi:hypothetical protein
LGCGLLKNSNVILIVNKEIKICWSRAEGMNQSYTCYVANKESVINNYSYS